MLDNHQTPAPAPRALWAASAIGGLGLSLAGAAGALLVNDIGGSPALAGLPQALLVVGAGLSAGLLAALTERVGRGPALAAGAAAAVLGCVVVVPAAAAHSLLGVLTGCLLLGAGNTALMLGRYAGADHVPERERARAMAAVLTATSFGAVAGPNLLAPATAAADRVGLPHLTGPYVVAALCFAAASVVLTSGVRTGPVSAITLPPRVGTDGPAELPAGTSHALGMVVLGMSNLVMVAVMTMAPVQLHHHGVGLGGIGLVVSLHIAGMFAPSPLSGWLTDRYGAARVAVSSAIVLVAACGLAATSTTVPLMLGVAMALLGLGWNLSLVAGSALLTAASPPHLRPRHESRGEQAMAIAALVGGAASGVVLAVSDYATLARLGLATVVATCVVTAFVRVNGRREQPRPVASARPGRVAGRG